MRLAITPGPYLCLGLTYVWPLLMFGPYLCLTLLFLALIVVRPRSETKGLHNDGHLKAGQIIGQTVRLDERARTGPRVRVRHRRGPNIGGPRSMSGPFL